MRHWGPPINPPPCAIQVEWLRTTASINNSLVYIKPLLVTLSLEPCNPDDYDQPLHTCTHCRKDFTLDNLENHVLECPEVMKEDEPTGQTEDNKEEADDERSQTEEEETEQKYKTGYVICEVKLILFVWVLRYISFVYQSLFPYNSMSIVIPLKFSPNRKLVI